MLTLTFTQKPEDLIAFNYYNAWAKPEKATQRNKSKFQVMAIALLALVGLMIFTKKWDWLLASMISGAALIYVLTMDFFVKMRVQRHIEAVMKKAPEGTVTGPRTWKVDDEGIKVELSGGDQSFLWSDVSRIENSTQHWMLYLGGKEALVLPKRALETPEAKESWKVYLHRLAVDK